MKEQYGLVRHQNESQRALHLEEQRKAKKLARLVEQVAELAEKKHNLERKIAHGNKEFHKKESKLVASNSKGALKALRKEHAKEHEALETQLSSVSEQLRRAKKQLKVLNPRERLLIWTDLLVSKTICAPQIGVRKSKKCPLQIRTIPSRVCPSSREALLANLRW